MSPRSARPGSRTANSSPPRPCDRVLAPDRVDESLGDVADELVARRVPEGVVHLLEPVEVDEEHADRLAISPGSHELLVDAVLEQAPVRQTGQRVVPCEVRDLLQQSGVLHRGHRVVGETDQPGLQLEIASRVGRQAERRNSP